ncbi:MAG: DinB family protein, partial [Gemmatimonadota bacterium]|nr:DinB family protein [Gemmatimonadota bacterium]
MSMAANLLPRFDQIVANTRQHLAAIPDDRLGWKPHDKSWTVGELGSHLANLSGWTMPTLAQDSLDVAPLDGDGPPPQPEY